MTRACSFVSLAVLLLAGCPTSRDGDGGGDLPIDALPRELARAYCDLVFRCEIGGDDLGTIELLFDDPASCASTLEGSVFSSGKLDGLMRAVSEGTVVYDASAARACTASIGVDCSAAVSGVNIGSGACDMVFTGTIPEGGTCWVSEECEGDLGCDFGDGTCPGTCAADAGFACGSDGACPAGQECFFPEVGTERCVTEILEGDAGEGEACGLVSETDTDVTRRGCQPGLWCTGDGYSMGTCRAPIAAGAPCSDSDEVCVDGHLCVEGSCRPVTVVRTEGAPCSEAALEICDPFARLRCVAGSCMEFTDGTSGSPCETGDFGETTCNEGLVCHGDTETCGAPLPAGAACTRDRECDSGACDYNTGTCRERYCDG